MLNNIITEQLKITYPIIQAPMAGGITTSKLVAEVSNAGGLGMVGAGYMTPAQIREQMREIKTLTSKSFGVNLFVPSEFDMVEDEVNFSNHVLHPIREQLQLGNNKTTPLSDFQEVRQKFYEQVRVVIEERVPICSFTFGIPSEEIIAELKKHNIILIGTACTVQEAQVIEKSGFDIVVVQGSEAGGHRGDFIKEGEGSIGLMSMIPQVVDHVNIPVIAAGGIMDGRGLIAAHCLGAKAVQMGTAFLTCIESGANENHKAAILQAKEDQTVLTRSFSGKWARGIENKFIHDMREHESLFPSFPIQNDLTKDIRKAASTKNNQAFMSLWSGQSPRLAKSYAAKRLIEDIMAEAKELI
ncbi:NAD(P)H-dependent flavin oxidoreductase [Virgibacillus soli]|uniref:Probable nitronate monooxygenase n=1 Tax=Paracerasibacillus soli TaxID=480284 RepID=A0ABU5CPS5_9BACI|nr:nitronate monooxygenase [Virgibacillus soli]MDY0407470.1 nitronate monooxygenase [Virgibacillus soli]